MRNSFSSCIFYKLIKFFEVSQETGSMCMSGAYVLAECVETEIRWVDRVRAGRGVAEERRGRRRPP